MFVPLLLALALMQARSAPDYAPDTGWRDEAWGRTFYEDWFGEQLRAMDEPSLSGEADLAGSRERFRLLVLPSFSPGYAYRLDVAENGSASLHWALLNGRGGYAPGALARQGSRRLRASELRAWQQAFAAAALGKLPRETQPEGISANEDGSQNVSICVDATMLVFEHLTARGRDYVIRDCDIEVALRRLLNVISRMKPRNQMN